MTEAAAATAPATESTNHGHIPKGIAAALADIMPDGGDSSPIAAPAPAAASPGAGGAQAATTAALDALADELFGDNVKWTPELLRERAKAVKDAAAEARTLRIKSHNARAEAERREAKLKTTKDAVLRDKSSVTAQSNFLAAELVELQSGDPERFIAAVGRLSRHPDPAAFWRDNVSIALAKGVKAIDPRDAKIAELERRMEEDRLEREQGRAQSTEQQIAQLREQNVLAAQGLTETHPALSRLASSNAPSVDKMLTELMVNAMRDGIPAEYMPSGVAHQPGTRLDRSVAFDMLESGLRSHLELLQPSNSPNGDLNAARGAAPPVGGQAGKPEQAAKPESALSPPPNSQLPSAIPSLLSAGSGASRRPVNRQEERERIIAELGPLLDNIVG